MDLDKDAHSKRLESASKARAVKRSSEPKPSVGTAIKTLSPTLPKRDGTSVVRGKALAKAKWVPSWFRKGITVVGGEESARDRFVIVSVKSKNLGVRIKSLTDEASARALNSQYSALQTTLLDPSSHPKEIADGPDAFFAALETNPSMRMCAKDISRITGAMTQNMDSALEILQRTIDNIDGAKKCSANL